MYCKYGWKKENDTETEEVRDMFRVLCLYFQKSTNILYGIMTAMHYFRFKMFTKIKF